MMVAAAAAASLAPASSSRRTLPSTPRHQKPRFLYRASKAPANANPPPAPSHLRRRRRLPHLFRQDVHDSSWRFFFSRTLATDAEACEKAGGESVREFRKRLRIADVKGGPDEGLDRLGQRLTIRGWVRTCRVQSSVAFVEVNDGSCLSNMQCVMSSDAEGYDQVESGNVATGASVLIEGTLVSSQGSKQKVELKVARLVVKEVASHTKGFVEKAAERNLLPKNGGYFKGQSLVERYLNKEKSKDIPLSSFREQYSLKYYPRAENLQLTNHWATYQSQEGEYYGTIATINVWSLQDVKFSDVSSARIAVINIGDGSPRNINAIQAGWHVNPSLYNDNNTHFFVHWTGDGFQKTGCVNLLCPGFVLTNHSRLIPGIRLGPTSSIDGAQYYITLKIYKDPQTGDWLLFEGSGDARNFVGYWPKSLFTSLATSASRISWGGMVAFDQSHTSPPMGSGHFPIDGDGKVATFMHVQYVNHKGDLEDPRIGGQAPIADKEDCYRVGGFRDSAEGGGRDGWTFLFGGPGGCID